MYIYIYIYICAHTYYMYVYICIYAYLKTLKYRTVLLINIIYLLTEQSPLPQALKVIEKVLFIVSCIKFAYNLTHTILIILATVLF